MCGSVLKMLIQPRFRLLNWQEGIPNNLLQYVVKWTGELNPSCLTIIFLLRF